jgi:hypothetical protein
MNDKTRDMYRALPALLDLVIIIIIIIIIIIERVHEENERSMGFDL